MTSSFCLKLINSLNKTLPIELKFLAFLSAFKVFSFMRFIDVSKVVFNKTMFSLFVIISLLIFLDTLLIDPLLIIYSLYIKIL